MRPNENEVAESNTEVKRNQPDESQIKLAQDNLDAFVEDIKTKLYTLKSDDALLAQFKKFLKEDASWTGMEALGIEELNKAFEKIKNTKDGVIYLKGLEVDALHHFVIKSTGTGKESADEFLRMIRSIQGALKMLTADRKMQIQLERVLVAAEQGVSIEEKIQKEEEE